MVVTTNAAQGASKQELLKATFNTFGLGEDEVIVQAWDKDFNDFADVDDDELVEGPTKVQITDKVKMMPVIFNADQLENGGE